MDEAWALISDPDTAELGLDILRRRCAARPDDAEALLELASAYDTLDREVDAEAAYRRLGEFGLDKLSPVDRGRWCVQFGSTLRLLGKLDESRAVLQRGAAACPDNPAIAAFLALTELETGNHTEAIQALVAAVLQSRHPEIEYYQRALRDYFSRLARGAIR